MVAWAIKGFGGMVPRTDARLLADNLAEQAVNCDVSTGAIEGIPEPEVVHDFGVVDGSVRRAYRFPSADGASEVWVPLPSEFSSVVRSPLANDTNRRLYWTNPGDEAPWWNTYARLDNGDPDYNLGIVQPSDSVGPNVAAVGGSATTVSRSYVYTYFNEYGEESAPSAPSDVVDGPSDATWTIDGWSTTVPANPAGRDYPPVTGVRLYRTVTGLQTGAQFFRVVEWTYTVGVPASYDDATSDTTVVNNTTLVSLDWGNPPDNLDGLTSLPGGMLVGFVGNTVHFCEPNRPHAWPAGYDQSLFFDIVRLGVWNQTLVALTSGAPSFGNGNSPANFTFNQLQVVEPCISRGSVVIDLSGVYYASHNGLMKLTSFGATNETLALVEPKTWINEYLAGDIVACRHATQYLAIDGADGGFSISFADPRLGFMRYSALAGVVCAWNDEATGAAYIMADGVVYRWDSTDVSTPLVFRWRSKQFYTPMPISLGACQISLDPSVADPPASEDPPPLDNGDATLALPVGVNAIFKLYAGPNGEHLITTRSLVAAREVFRIPGGFKAFGWQCEIVSRVKVHSIELATTVRELGGA